MKTVKFTIILIAAIALQAESSAQNPFETLGQDAKILTLSDGLYNEFHNNDSLVKVGSVIFNRRTNKIAWFVEQDTMYSEATLEPEVISRWLSRDPLARDFPEMSPYAGMGNNPIYFIDEEGGRIKPANQAAIQALRATIESFTTGNVTGEELFGVKSEPLTFRGQAKRTSDNVLFTDIGAKGFKKQLRKSGLKGQRKEEAKAFFKVLSSTDVVEVGVITPTTQANLNAPQGTGQEQVFTENPQSTPLLQQAEVGSLTQNAINQAFAQQRIQGQTTGGGQFAFFPEPSHQQRVQESLSQLSPPVALKGLLLINPPARSQPLDPSVRGVDIGAVTQSIREAISGIKEEVRPAVSFE